MIQVPDVMEKKHPIDKFLLESWHRIKDKVYSLQLLGGVFASSPLFGTDRITTIGQPPKASIPSNPTCMACASATHDHTSYNGIGSVGLMRNQESTHATIHVKSAYQILLSYVDPSRRVESILGRFYMQ